MWEIWLSFGAGIAVGIGLGINFVYFGLKFGWIVNDENTEGQVNK